MLARRLILACGGAVICAPSLLAVPAAAQGVCHALWYDRNSIYAQAGHCFQTARAIEHFGRGCFPPYGRLTPSQQRRVNEIQAQEDMRGCPR
jgi:hypothetical protein